MALKIVNVTVSIIILILAATASMAYPSGEPVSIFNIGQCYGNLLVKVQPHEKIGDYSLLGCQRDDIIWTCPCINDTSVTFVTSKDIINIYDFTLQYYNAKLESDGNFSRSVLTEAHKRDLEKKVLFTVVNITFTPNDINMTAMNLTGKEEVDITNILLLAGGISILCLLIGFGVWSMFRNNVEKEEEKRRQERRMKSRPPLTQTDEELIAEARKMLDEVD